MTIVVDGQQNLHADELHFVGQSLPALAARLTQHDKKSVESVCLAFSRLVDSFHNDPDRLHDIASKELLSNLQVRPRGPLSTTSPWWIPARCFGFFSETFIAGHIQHGNPSRRSRVDRICFYVILTENVGFH